MKVVIGEKDSLPEGEYELTDQSKLERAIGNFTIPPSDRQVLLEYDRIGGQVKKDGKVLPPQSLWNMEKHRPIEAHSDDELVTILRRAENVDVPGSLYQRSKNEWQQRRHDQNTKQIASLIDEVRSLKEITDETARTSAKDAENSKKLSKIAILIAVVALTAQVFFSIKQEKHCDLSSTGGSDNLIHYLGCRRIIWLGPLDPVITQLPDYSVPNGQ